MSQTEASKGHEGASLVTEQRPHDELKWTCNWNLRKDDADVHALVAEELGLRMVPFETREMWTPGDEARIAKATADVLDRLEPYEVIEGKGNMLVNAGINHLWTLACGGGGTAFTNAAAHIGVGDSATAAAASQTDLVAATNKLRRAMNGGFPTHGTLQKAVWQSTFGTGDANWVWNEWAIFNAAAAGIMLNRKVEALGTKSGGSWTLTVEVSLS